MESNNSTTRTYTALTCELIVAKQNKQQLGLESRLKSGQQDRQPQVDFILNLDDPDRQELDPIVLKGHFHQLDLLHQVVDRYITELIAKFPLPTMNNSTSDHGRSTTADRDRPELTPETAPDRSIASKLYPNHDDRSTRSGLMNNLPGLRNNSAEPPATNDPNPPSNAASGSGISKLFGGWNKRDRKSPESKPQHTPLGAAAGVKSGFGKREVEQLADSSSTNSTSPTTPYITGNDGSLDRELHLGDLANETAGDIVTLSPIQLFDLSTVLDEYAADEAGTSTEKTPSAVFSRTNIPTNRQPAADEATTALSRLPNLPRTSGKSQTSQVFNRTRHTNYGPQFSFMSVVPWAAAAAVAVGIPLLLLDPKPNPLKDATSKVKVPDLEGVKKTVAEAMAPPDVDAEPTDKTAGNLPKPWKEQAVQPPQTGKIASNPSTQQPQTSTTLPNTQPPQSIGKIGIAPLPTELVGKPGQDLSVAGTPSNNEGPKPSTLPAKTAPLDIAPNPLSSPGVGSVGTTPQLSPAAKSALKAVKSIPAKTTTAQPSNSATPVAPVLGSMTKPIIGVSDLPGIGINSSNSSQPQLSPVQIEPVTTKPPTAVKTTKPKAKSPVVAKKPEPKPVKSTGISAVRQPLFEQNAPIPANPLIDPAQLPINNAEFQNLPPADPTFPTSTDGNWPGNSSIDSPSLQETKRYFQSKWKANNAQTNALQYVVQIGGKNGLIKGIAPQGEAATTYLQKSKFAKVGQKLVSPAAAGNTDQKIRVIFQPDGNVDTFPEPQ